MNKVKDVIDLIITTINNNDNDNSNQNNSVIQIEKRVGNSEHRIV